MAQPSVVIVTLAVVGALGGLAYVHASRDETKPSTAPTEFVRGPDETPPAPVAAQPAELRAQATTTPQNSTPDVGRWIADTQSNDARIRAVAIEALANAPKAQALPALERVLESGEPQVDRQIALRSLHTLALSDGDDTGKIRDAIRHALYHSEDENVTQTAQALLEDIEAAFDERAQGAR